MRKIFLLLLTTILLTGLASSFGGVLAAEQNPPDTNDTDLPIVCGCPSELTAIYTEKNTGESCVTDLASFKEDPTMKHLWVEDAEITAQGKADDRARQFIYWVITHTSNDNHPVILKVWAAARNVAYFMVLLVGAIMGLSIIINQRTNFSSSIKVWPSIWKILLILLYISFSATLAITIIQLSEILMKFFIETLGGSKLFNIYFAAIDRTGGTTGLRDLSTEANYSTFFGCRDLNIRVQEAVKAEMVLLKLTNISYYVMGGMLLLRKVLLWFLIVVSPFIGILMPFIFIRNIGWIWIGVFFQWVFYGPLFALFLGGLAKIWEAGIPFIFDFSRVGKSEGYIYPTAINILYGGPAQRLAVVNNGNYIDTFAEYIITLIMLWAVTFFPWWLLRIFRDYCCDAINASKNILMSMYDQMRGGPGPSPTTGPTPGSSATGTAMKMPREVEVSAKVRLETMEEIKKAKTEEITRSFNVKASTLTDVARFETNKTLKETVNKNINYLKNPTQAETPTERQKYMNIRTELFNRAVKEDVAAKQFLTSISTSKVEHVAKRQEMLKTISQMVPVTKLEQIKIKPGDIKAPAGIAEQTAVGKAVTGKTTTTEKVPAATPVAQKSIEEVIPVPPTVPIEEYEQVKRMWREQYEKGEVPTTENITSREAWVDQDVVFITNTLNKLFSPNEEIRHEGLDDVGYILPIFLVNNLKGDQLVVYLKAKLEAAKQVKEMKEKEREITEKLKPKTEEELIDVEKPKEKTAEKTMEMKAEIKPEESKSETKPSETSSKPEPSH